MDEEEIIFTNDRGRTLHIRPEGDGFRLMLCRCDQDEDDDIVEDEISVPDEEALADLLDTRFKGFVSEDDYMEIYEIAVEANVDAGEMLKKRFPGIEGEIAAQMDEHFDENIYHILDDDFTERWNEEHDLLASDEAENWTDGYKNVVAGFYSTVIDDVIAFVHGKEAE